MQYDVYEARIEKIANFIKFFFRNKIKLMIFFSFALLITATLLFTKGTIVGADSCPEEVGYGQKLNWQADAFLADVRYEYREKNGSTWTEEEPTLVGDYCVRAVADSLFGNRYSDEYSFSIIPKSITVSVNSATYGEAPTVVAPTVRNDVISDFSYIYSEIDTEKMTIAAEIESGSVKIKNQDGKDVTNCYNIKVSEKTSVPLKPREVTVHVPDKSKVWDGTPIFTVQDECSIIKGSVVYDDVLFLSFSQKFSDVRVESNVPTYTVMNTDGEDMTRCYNIDFGNPTLTVTKRPVKVVTEGVNTVYDGEMHSNDRFDSQGLRENDKFIIKDSTRVDYVGDTPNKINDYEILDAQGEKVTDFYELDQSECGIIKITHRDLSVTTADASKTYDGDVLYSTDLVEKDGLVEGHTVKVISSTSITNVSESGKSNQIIEYDIVDKSGNSVKDNYNLSVEKEGTLTITPRPFTVTTENDSKVYDATPLEKTNAYSVLGLATDHEFKVISSSSITNVRESGAKNEIYEWDVVITGTNDSVKKNYDITLNNYGKLTIDPRPITVYTADDNKIYDATPLKNSTYSKVEGIVEGHIFKILDSTAITDVIESVAKNNKVLSYDIYDGAGQSVKDNYSVGYECGTLTVYQRAIKVITASGSKLYDGTKLTNAGIEVVGLVNKDGIVHSYSGIYTVGSRINVGESDNEYNADALKIVDNKNKDVTQNYYINSHELGILKVTPRYITVHTSDGHKTYDATPLSNPSYDDISGDKMAPGQTFNITKSTEITNVAESGTNNVPDEFVIRDASGNVIDSNNYVVSYDPGTLSISPRPLEIITNSHQFTYNGAPQVYKHFTYVNEDDRAFTEKYVGDITYKNPAMITNVWEKVENVFELEIYDTGSVIISQNYEVKIVEKGILTVKARDITFRSEDRTFDYNAEWQRWEVVNIHSGDLGVDHTAVYTFSGKIKDVGNADNEFKVQIFSGTTPIDERNYNITTLFGTLTVNPRKITLTTGSDSKEWDGTPLYSHVWELSKKSANTIINGHEIYLPDSYLKRFTASRTDVGKSQNTYELVVGSASYYPIIRDKNTKEDVTKNYDVEHIFGTLEVTKRNITVYTSSAQKVYDAKPLTNPAYDKIVGILDGHKFVIKSSTSITEVKESGDNKVFEYDIVDSATSKNSFYNNYEVKYVYGKLEIKRLAVTLYTLSATKDYDGTALTAPGWDESVLVGGHKVKSPVPNGSRTDVGKSDNTYNSKAQIVIVSGTSDVTDNYEITAKLGVLEVLPAYVYVTTKSDSKTYDGTPLTNQGFTAKGLKAGHKFVVKKSTSITDASSVDNIFTEYDIVDSSGKNSVLSEYKGVKFTNGTLTIEKRKITVSTSSAVKLYDSKPLTAPTFEISPKSQKLVSGHKFFISSEIKAKFVGTQTAIGTSRNTYNLTSEGSGAISYYWPAIIDGNGKDVSSNYDFGDSIEIGYLTVVPSGIGLPKNYDADAASGMIVFTLTSDTSGKVYLKTASYGKYTGSGFELSEDYTEFYDGKYSASQILALIQDANYNSSSVITIDPKAGIYAIPYYSASDELISDCYAIGDPSYSYSTEAFLKDYYQAINNANTDLSDFEKAYRDFVYKNDDYTKVDEKTLEFMLEIIKKEGFSKDDSDIILKVSEYIKFSAYYNLDYDRALDKEGNIVTAFLSDYKEGVSHHYAAAATMLYRALGMPARYTVGYAIDVIGGESVDVSELNACAWVEVYVDGIGWVKVDVTGYSKKTVTLDPIDVSYNFDEAAGFVIDSASFTNGNTSFASLNKILKEDETLAALLKEGFTYRITFSGKQEGIGKSEYTIKSFTLIAPHGRVVSDYFTVVKDSGYLEILPIGEVEIYIHQNISAYTGSPIKADKYSYKEKIPGNLTLDFKFDISLTSLDVGYTEKVIKASMINADTEKYITFNAYVDGKLIDGSGITIKVVNWDEENEGRDYEVVKVTVREIMIEIVATRTLKVGEKFNYLTDCQVIATMGDDVLTNYNFSVTFKDIDTSIAGSKDILIDGESIKIFDLLGNDVSHNFSYYTEVAGMRIPNIKTGKIAVTK